MVLQASAHPPVHPPRSTGSDGRQAVQCAQAMLQRRRELKQTAKQSLERGIGIGPLPLHVVAPDVVQGRLWQLPPYRNLPSVDVHLCPHPGLRMTPAEAALLARLQDEIARIPFAERTYGA